MQCCGKRGITSRVIKPLRMAASPQGNIELYMILASIEAAKAAGPIYCSSLMQFSMFDTDSVATKMKPAHFQH